MTFPIPSPNQGLVAFVRGSKETRSVAAGVASISYGSETVVNSPRRKGKDMQHVVESSRPKQARLRVLLAEDQYLTREGTRRLLEERDDLEVVGTADDYDSVIGEARRLQPDVVVMDVKMPPTYTMEGIEAAHRIRTEFPRTGILVLTQHDDEAYVWALLGRGVAGLGYLHKVRVGDLDQLVRAMREVAAGGSVLDPRIVEQLLAFRSRKPGSAIAELTPAERDTLRLMAEGKNNPAIAGELSVSLGAVEKRIAAILSKLGLAEERDLNRRVAAVLVYLRETGASDRPPGATGGPKARRP